jgi:2-dehydropantoate 2-reductase
MEIKTAAIVGLGALGVLFGHQIEKSAPEGALRILADGARVARYRQEGVFANGEACRFRYVTPEAPGESADLLIFSVKFGALSAAVEAARGLVGPDTVILSLLNGIISEEVIGRALGAEKVLPAVAQGMDAVKVGNRLTCHHMGMICFGNRPDGGGAAQTAAVARFFERTGVPFQIMPDMRRHLWSKFMLNVGVNQAVAVFECDYRGVQRPGEARDTMIAAMREALTLAQAEGVDLTEADIDYWLRILDGLSPSGKPSMRQDLEAGRKSEVDLFAGTVAALSAAHFIDCPVNRMLLERIRAMEESF